MNRCQDELRQRVARKTRTIVELTGQLLGLTAAVESLSQHAPPDGAVMVLNRKPGRPGRLHLR